MELPYSQNNRIIVSGKVCSSPTLSHEVYGESFYKFFIEVPRLSEASDILPVTISERLLSGLSLNTKITLSGQIRSYNSYSDGKNHLILTLFAKEAFTDILSEENPNQVSLIGYICKPPVYRTTPFGREIADVLLAVNRAFNKSDYIPCIAWGKNARYVGGLEVGKKIELSGRMQSRKYQKKLSETEILEKTAYEISISKITDSALSI